MASTASLDALVRRFERRFALRAKVVTYAVLIPITTIAFVFILDLSEAQKKYFVPLVIGVAVFSIITSKFVTPFIMKRFKDFIRRTNAGEEIPHDEMLAIRRSYSRIPMLLAVDSGLRWALGLFLVAIGLRLVSPLSITSIVTFFTIGFSNTFLSFLIYYVVGISLVKEMAGETVYRGIDTKTFQLMNRISLNITVIVVGIILFIAALLTTITYTLVNNAMVDAYHSQMTNINRVVNITMERTLDSFAHDAEGLALSETALKGTEGADISAWLLSSEKKLTGIESVFVASAAPGTPIKSSSHAGAEGKALDEIKELKSCVSAALAGRNSYSSTAKSIHSGNTIVLLAVPVRKGNAVTGLLGIEIKPSAVFSPIVRGVAIGQGGYPYILDSEYRVIGHPNDKTVGTNILDYEWGKALKKSDDLAFLKYEWEGRSKSLTFIRNQKYGIISVSSAYYSDMESAALKTTQAQIFVLLIVCLGIGVAVYFIIGRNLDSIKTVQKAIYGMAKGEVSATLAVSSADEIGAISADLNTFILKLREVVSAIKEMSVEFASSSEEMSAATLSFSDNAQSQAASAEEITATVEELSAGMDTISVGANEQNERLGSLISEMTNLSKIITDMGGTIQSALRATETVSANARAGEESLHNMNDIMAKITESSHSMTGIVKIINDISAQINLLSLNAAIEAARAGESGRGFAVVADEISKLADETASSIKEIDMLISENNQMIGKGMQSVTLSIETISTIIDSVTSIADMMKTIGDFMQSQALLNSRVNTEADKVKRNAEQIKHATEEHKIAIADIVKSIGSINELTQSNAGGAEEMASNAKDLSNRAETLNNAINFFKL